MTSTHGRCGYLRIEHPSRSVRDMHCMRTVSMASVHMHAPSAVIRRHPRANFKSENITSGLGKFVGMRKIRVAYTAVRTLSVLPPATIRTLSAASVVSPPMEENTE